jgi:hypothetical protein
MKTWTIFAVIASTAAYSSGALADDLYPEPRRQPPKAHTGFQLSLRAGAAIPLGDVARNTAMSDFTTAQFAPFIVSVGGKIIPELYLGGYFGYQLGAPAGALGDLCDRADGGCLTGSLRFGIEAQAHILPSGFVNPWVGYGFGFESLGAAESNNGETRSQGFAGLEFARISAGLDIRINRIFGFGPFADFALGRYTTAATGDTSRDIDEDARTTHGWITVGARFVFFP